jgi:hypothetical protein
MSRRGATDPLGKVSAGFFSFTEVTRADQHRSYNEWHQLDHMPEQYPLRGIVFGQRWVSTPACRRARVLSEAPLDPVHYVTLYLMSEPMQETLREFRELARRLRRAGRFHEHRHAHLSGPFRLLEARAAGRVRVSPEAVPFRPNRGIFVTVEDVGLSGAEAGHGLDEPPMVELLRAPGVAGIWRFGPYGHDAGWAAGNRVITVVYLDDDPVKLSAEVGAALESRWRRSGVRPVFAGPFETITPWEWDWFDGNG